MKKSITVIIAAIVVCASLSSCYQNGYVGRYRGMKMHSGGVKTYSHQNACWR